MLKKLLFVSDNIGNLLDNMSDFSARLKGVNEMETYYGDEVLQGLVDHCKTIVEEIENYSGIYTLLEEEGEDVVYEEDPFTSVP